MRPRTFAALMVAAADGLAGRRPGTDRRYPGRGQGQLRRRASGRDGRSPQPIGVGVSTAVTDAKGVYRFPALPPGTYEVTANLQGFAPAKVRRCRSSRSAKMLTIDLTLGSRA